MLAMRSSPFPLDLHFPGPSAFSTLDIYAGTGSGGGDGENFLPTLGAAVPQFPVYFLDHVIPLFPAQLCAQLARDGLTR